MSVILHPGLGFEAFLMSISLECGLTLLHWDSLDMDYNDICYTSNKGSEKKAYPFKPLQLSQLNSTGDVGVGGGLKAWDAASWDEHNVQTRGINQSNNSEEPAVLEVSYPRSNFQFCSISGSNWDL